MMFSLIVGLVAGFCIGAEYKSVKLKGKSVEELEKENERLKYFLSQYKPKPR